MDNRIGIIMPSSTWTMAWMHRQNPRWLWVHLVPWLAWLIMWSCGIILGIQSEWFDAHAWRQGLSWMQRKGDG